MGYFISFWYVSSFSRFYASFLSSLSGLEDNFAIRTTLHNLDKPLFQDYTRQGRIIGFFLRLGRILAGLIFYLVLALMYLVAYLVWLLFPLFCLATILGSFLASPSTALSPLP